MPAIMTFLIDELSLNNSLFALVRREFDPQFEQIIPTLVRMGVNINSNQRGETALHIAINTGKNDIASVLIKNGADLFIRNWDGDSSFQKAVHNNSVALIPFILEQLSHNPIYQVTQIAELDEALICAYLRGYKQIFIMLVEYILAHNRDTNLLIRALIGAASNGWDDQIITLLNQGVNVNSIGQNRNTALHDASYNNHTETVALLLDRGADVNAQDSNEFTPLIFATERGYIPIIVLLLKRKPDISLVDVHGKTAFDYAKRSGIIQKIFEEAGFRA